MASNSNNRYQSSIREPADEQSAAHADVEPYVPQMYRSPLQRLVDAMEQQQPGPSRSRPSYVPDDWSSDDEDFEDEQPQQEQQPPVVSEKSYQSDSEEEEEEEQEQNSLVDYSDSETETETETNEWEWEAGSDDGTVLFDDESSSEEEEIEVVEISDNTDTEEEEEEEVVPPRTPTIDDLFGSDSDDDDNADVETVYATTEEEGTPVPDERPSTSNASSCAPMLGKRRRVPSESDRDELLSDNGEVYLFTTESETGRMAAAAPKRFKSNCDCVNTRTLANFCAGKCCAERNNDTSHRGKRCNPKRLRMDRDFLRSSNVRSFPPEVNYKAFRAIQCQRLQYAPHRDVHDLGRNMVSIAAWMMSEGYDNEVISLTELYELMFHSTWTERSRECKRVDVHFGIHNVGAHHLEHHHPEPFAALETVHQMYQGTSTPELVLTDYQIVALLLCTMGYKLARYAALADMSKTRQMGQTALESVLGMFGVPGSAQHFAERCGLMLQDKFLWETAENHMFEAVPRNCAPTSFWTHGAQSIAFAQAPVCCTRADCRDACNKSTKVPKKPSPAQIKRTRAAYAAAAVEPWYSEPEDSSDDEEMVDRSEALVQDPRPNVKSQWKLGRELVMMGCEALAKHELVTVVPQPFKNKRLNRFANNLIQASWPCDAVQHTEDGEMLDTMNRTLNDLKQKLDRRDGNSSSRGLARKIQMAEGDLEAKSKNIRNRQAAKKAWLRMTPDCRPHCKYESYLHDDDEPTPTKIIEARHMVDAGYMMCVAAHLGLFLDATNEAHWDPKSVFGEGGISWADFSRKLDVAVREMHCHQVGATKSAEHLGHFVLSAGVTGPFYVNKACAFVQVNTQN
uniref:Protein ORF3 n=1 Tax=Cyprinid herpesvirus 2 TaxID=317878 RepID=A0A6H0QXJ3_CYHV2